MKTRSGYVASGAQWLTAQAGLGASAATSPQVASCLPASSRSWGWAGPTGSEGLAPAAMEPKPLPTAEL